MILKTSQAQWALGRDDNCWSIADEDNNQLIVFPKAVQDHEANAIRRFAMKYEQLAYDEGIEAGKHIMLAANNQKLRELADENKMLKYMNEELSIRMQRFFGEMDED